MSIRETIHNAGQNLHTILLTAREDDGSVEVREAEPYSFKVTKAGRELFYCYDVKKEGMRSFGVENIIQVEETQTTFSPRFPVQV